MTVSRKADAAEVGRGHLALGQVHYIRTMAGIRAEPNVDQAAIYSIGARSFTLLRNAFDDLVGYVLWADVSRETYVQLRDRGTFPRYSYEWDDGPVALIVDVVILPEWRGALTGALLGLRHGHRAIAARRAGRSARLHLRG